MPRFAALIVAAGRGSRAGRAVPKQYEPVAGVPVLRRSIDALRRWEADLPVIVAIAAADRDRFDAATSGLRDVTATTGGATRQKSVCAGLRALAAGQSAPEYVMIHDAARPFCPPDLLARLAAAVGTGRGAVPVLPVTDTLNRTVDGRIAEPVDRNGLAAMQTPQVFPFPAIRAAHERASAENGADITDDVAVARRAGLDFAAVPGDPANLKLTWPEDFAIAETRLAFAGTTRQSRTGQGFDVHAFGPGDRITLCGVAIPHDHGLVGHSDADVGLHALTDAILGAICDGDIGSHFPPSDPQWAGAASRVFLADAAARAAARGGVIVNLDVTLICQAPRIGPHRDTMRARIAEICAVDVGRVAVKATTSEGLGFTGRGEGIAALATATLELPAGTP